MESVNVGGIEVALPPTSADLELGDLKTKDGRPVTIRCGRVSVELISVALEGIPAESPKVGIDAGKDGSLTPEQLTRAARMVGQFGPVIEAGCSLVTADGDVVFPAFGPGLIPVSALSVNDAGHAFATISFVSGLGKEASPFARFRYDYGSGLDSGDGAGRPGPGVRDEAIGAAQGPAGAGAGPDDQANSEGSAPE